MRVFGHTSPENWLTDGHGWTRIAAKIVSRWGAFLGQPTGVVKVMDGLLVFEK
jgi:hypothetical protein